MAWNATAMKGSRYVWGLPETDPARQAFLSAAKIIEEESAWVEEYLFEGTLGLTSVKNMLEKSLKQPDVDAGLLFTSTGQMPGGILPAPAVARLAQLANWTSIEINNADDVAALRCAQMFIRVCVAQELGLKAGGYVESERQY